MDLLDTDKTHRLLLSRNRQGGEGLGMGPNYFRLVYKTPFGIHSAVCEHHGGCRWRMGHPLLYEEIFLPDKKVAL